MSRKRKDTNSEPEVTDNKKPKKGRAIRIDVVAKEKDDLKVMNDKKPKKGRAVPLVEEKQLLFRNKTLAQFRELSQSSQLTEILHEFEENPVPDSPLYGMICIKHINQMLSFCLDNRERSSALLFGFGLFIPECVKSVKQGYKVYFHSNDVFGMNHVGVAPSVANFVSRADDPESVLNLESFLRSSESFLKQELYKFKTASEKQHRVQFECFPNTSCGVAPFIQFRDSPSCDYCMSKIAKYQERIRHTYSEWREETSILGPEHCPLRVTVIRAFPDPEREAAGDVGCRFESLIPHKSKACLSNTDHTPTPADKQVMNTLASSKFRPPSLKPSTCVPDSSLLREYTAFLKELDVLVESKSISDTDRKSTMESLSKIHKKAAYKDGIELLMLRKFRSAFVNEMVPSYLVKMKNPEAIDIRVVVAGENDMEGFMPAVMCNKLDDSGRSRDDLAKLLSKTRDALLQALTKGKKTHFLHVACHPNAAVGICPYVVLKDYPIPRWGMSMIVDWSDEIRSMYSQHLSETKDSGGARMRSTVLRCNEDDCTDEDKLGVACFFQLDKINEKPKAKQNDYLSQLIGIMMNELFRA